jgi:hypothetical protein
MSLKPTRVVTDAFDIGLGGVLLQEGHFFYCL